MKNKSILLFSFIAFTFFSCSKKESITVSGSTTVLPVISNAAEVFKKSHLDLNIIVNAGGSGVGMNQLGEKKTDIGMISRDITNEEVLKYPDANFNVIAIGKDAVVAVVSSEIYDAGITELTIAQLASIYKGEVKNWKELGGPDKDILCVDKEAARGTRHVFMEIVLGDKEAEAPGADLVLGSNNEEQTAIVQSDAAIGMLSNAWLNKDVKGLRIKMADGSSVAPTIANIINGTYPITRNLEIVTRGKPTGQLKEFIDYILSAEGQKVVKRAGYVEINK
jgi:phosphate transport system substrate-binding protein